MTINIIPNPAIDSNIFDSQINKRERVVPLGYAMTDSWAKEVGGGFAFSSLDTVEWTAANSGVGSASGAANQICTMTSGTANSGYGSLNSANTARFLYITSNIFRALVRVTATGGANTTRSWGAFNFGTKPAIQDGYFFSYDGSSSTLSINNTKAGVNTSVASGSFNGEVSSYTLDTNQHLFEILYHTFSVWFFIDGVLIHKLATTTNILLSNAQLSASAVALNSSIGTTSVSLEVWAMHIMKATAVEAAPRYSHINANGTNVLRVGPGTLQRVVINTFGSASNSTTLYDSTSGAGTVIAVVSTSGGSGSPVTLNYGLTFVNGLTVVMATGTAADITVLFD